MVTQDLLEAGTFLRMWFSAGLHSKILLASNGSCQDCGSLSSPHMQFVTSQAHYATIGLWPWTADLRSLSTLTCRIEKILSQPFTSICEIFSCTDEIKQFYKSKCVYRTWREQQQVWKKKMYVHGCIGSGTKSDKMPPVVSLMVTLVAAEREKSVWNNLRVSNTKTKMCDKNKLQWNHGLRRPHLTKNSSYEGT